MVSGLSDFSQQIHRIVGTYAEQEFGACIPELHSTDETKSRVFWAGSLLWARSGAWGFVPVSGAIRKPPNKGLSVTVKWASGKGQNIELVPGTAGGQVVMQDTVMKVDDLNFAGSTVSTFGTGAGDTLAQPLPAS